MGALQSTSTGEHDEVVVETGGVGATAEAAVSGAVADAEASLGDTGDIANEVEAAAGGAIVKDVAAATGGADGVGVAADDAEGAAVMFGGASPIGGADWARLYPLAASSSAVRQLRLAANKGMDLPE